MFKCSTWRFTMCLLYKLLCLCACFFFPAVGLQLRVTIDVSYLAGLFYAVGFHPESRGTDGICWAFAVVRRFSFKSLTLQRVWSQTDRKHVLLRQTRINVRRTFSRNLLQLECKNAWQFWLKMSEITCPVFHLAAHPSLIVAFKYYIFQL